MTVQDEFSDDEWYLLSSVPAMIGSAMSAAASSGVLGTVKELTASIRAVAQGRDDHPESALIQALMRKADDWEETKARLGDYRERTRARLEASGVESREQLLDLVLADCRAAAQLVDERCSASDAAAYRSWSVSIARRVAEAAKEGGFLGVGGVRVSDEEREMLGRIETELGVPGGSLLA